MMLWNSYSQTLAVYKNHLECLLKHKVLGATARVSVSVGAWWGPEVWISNKFSSLGTTFLEPPL